MTRPLSLSQQVRLLQWAAAEGLLSREEVGFDLDPAAATLSEADVSGRFQAFFVLGRLKDRLEEALAADGPVPPAFRASSSPGAIPYESVDLAPEDLKAFPLPRDGRYQPLAFLGEGGMGRVYKVFDQQLKRVAAVKFLKHLDRGPLERFLQEARAQAQIDHPNVCNIFSVEEWEGQPYLSMRFIDGPTLKEAMGRLTLAEQVRIIMQMAQALQACHSLGIVHRDLKPGNIMLERREDGTWWPYLLDFGLARNLSDAGLTVQGMILGTPIYCSPEQVQGRMEDVDARSDLYALGATLYECLGGEPPFPLRSDLLDLVRRISHEDPISLSLHHPGLPRDLQIIAMKALEKEPARRYPTAQALAEDLRRFLDGDPILARGAGRAYRLARVVRKHRVAAVTALVSLLLVLAFGTFGILMGWRSRLQSQSGFQFGREAEHMEALLERAYSLPLHDLRPDFALVQAELDRIQAGMARLSRWSRPAAHLALGRGYLALGRLEEARTELERGGGGSGGPDPDTALAMGLTLARLYEADLEGLRGPSLAERKRELEATLRRPALACLRRTQGAHQDGPAYVEGLLALVEGRFEDAILKARDYQTLAPWAYEGPVLEAQAEQAIASTAFEDGLFDPAETHLARAGAALDRALAVACGAPTALDAEAARRLLAFRIRLARGQASPVDRDWALEAVQRCLRANPEDWRALDVQAALLRHWGVLELSRGEVPTASLDGAVAAAEAGLRVRPQDNPLWTILGAALRNRADWEVSQGQDPTPTLDRAIQAQRQALARPQFKDWLLDSIGCCYSDLGHYLTWHGGDPTQAIREAQGCLTQAETLKPWVGHVTNIGDALHERATYLRLTGGDPAPSLQEARQAFETGIQLNGHSFQVHQGLASLLLDWAEGTQAQGRPDPDLLLAAQGELEVMLALNPGLGERVHPALARVHALEALAHQADPVLRREALRRARAELLLAANRDRPKPETATLIAEACLVLQKADPLSRAAVQGLAALRPALAGRRWDSRAVYLESRLLASLGEQGAADEAFRQACAINGNLRGAPRL